MVDLLYSCHFSTENQLLQLLCMLDTDSLTELAGTSYTHLSLELLT